MNGIEKSFIMALREVLEAYDVNISIKQDFEKDEHIHFFSPDKINIDMSDYIDVEDLNNKLN